MNGMSGHNSSHSAHMKMPVDEDATDGKDYADDFEEEQKHTPASSSSRGSGNRGYIDKTFVVSTNEEWERWRAEAESLWRDELREKEHALRQSLDVEVPALVIASFLSLFDRL